MEKMPALELGVIPFNAEDDIIVTSGSNYHGLSSGRTYFSLGSQMEEAFPESNTTFSTNGFYKFNYNTEVPGFHSLSTSPSKIDLIDPNYDYYAWYDSGNWFTQDKTKEYYYNESKNKYIWTTDNTN